MTTETAIEAILNGDNFFKCHSSGCRMEKAACVIRRRNAVQGWIVGKSSTKPGTEDPTCRTCEQGKKIEKEVSPGAVKAYQMRVGGSRKWDKKAMEKPGQITEPEWKVCSRKECRHEGRPQPADNFHKGSRKDGLCGYCKDCQRDMAEERKQKLAVLKKSLRDRLDRAAGIEPTAEPGPTKVCPDPACPAERQPQPLDNFHRNKGTADGHAYHCKVCMLRRQKEYDQRRRNAVKPKENEVTEKTEKRCNTCQTIKPIKEFSPSNTSKDGFMHICRKCCRDRQESGLRRENDVTLLKLNFNEHPDLLAELARVATVEFRTVQAQAMFIIERALAR